MKRKILSAAALLALFVAPTIAEAAVRGFATANVNMRSGPSTRYPAVVVIPNGAPVTIHGCLSEVPWCDVSFARGRGWVAGRYVQAAYRQNRVYVEPRYYRDLGVPTIGFDVDVYWNRHYRDRDFYRDRDRWRRPDRDDWGRAPHREPDRRPGRDQGRNDGRGPGPNDGRWEQQHGRWDDDNRPPRGENRPPRRDDARPPQRDEGRDRRNRPCTAGEPGCRAP